jgi:hypothetical protein
MSERRTQDEIMKLLGTDEPINRARKVFSSWCARIEQAGQQRTPLSPVEMRRMEFEAVEAIIQAAQSETVEGER